MVAVYHGCEYDLLSLAILLLGQRLHRCTLYQVQGIAHSALRGVCMCDHTCSFVSTLHWRLLRAGLGWYTSRIACCSCAISSLSGQLSAKALDTMAYIISWSCAKVGTSPSRRTGGTYCERASTTRWMQRSVSATHTCQHSSCGSKAWWGWVRLGLVGGGVRETQHDG